MNILSKFDARVRFGTLGAILSALAAYLGQPYLHQRPESLNTIVTVFSILAGFLVAIISIVGDSTSLGRGSWRRDHHLIEGVKRRLYRHKLMFQLYLAVLGLVFVVQLVDMQDHVVIWYERTILFLACFAFLSSLALPEQLMNERLQKVAKEAAPIPEALQRRIEGVDEASREE